MPSDPARLERLLGGGDLAVLRQRLRKRYMASDMPADGFTLGKLTAGERDALTGLLGRPRDSRQSLRLSHQQIDAALQAAGLADDLRQALECLDGPIVDTHAAREGRQRQWAALFSESTDPRLVETFADGRTQGLLKRLAGRDIDQARRLIGQTERVLGHLPGHGIARARLAADVLGDAHALDPAKPVATLLRRALDSTRQHERMRDLWAEQGVLVNELAKPVVVLNLQATGDGEADQLLATAALAGEPLHLSLRILARQPPVWRAGQTIHVCENPEVLAAAADALGCRCPPMISIDGQLSAAPRTLLDQLAEAGARLTYHGDFDWPGVRIGNGIVARYGAIPWRYSVEDYAPSDGPPLAGEPVAAVWDAELAVHMQSAGIAVHEESQLDGLIADLEEIAGLE